MKRLYDEYILTEYLELEEYVTGTKNAAMHVKTIEVETKIDLNDDESLYKPDTKIGTVVSDGDRFRLVCSGYKIRAVDVETASLPF